MGPVDREDASLNVRHFAVDGRRPVAHDRRRNTVCLRPARWGKGVVPEPAWSFHSELFVASDPWRVHALTASLIR